MQTRVDSELRQLQASLQKMDDGLAAMLQNQAIKAWNNISIPENADLIFFFGVRSNPSLHPQAGGKNLQGLIDAQIAFRLHPARKIKDDIYHTVTELRRTINAISDTLAVGADSEELPTALKTAAEEHQARMAHFNQAGKLLQIVYLNLRRFCLLDLVGYIRQRFTSNNPLEQRFLQNGCQLFTLSEDKNPDAVQGESQKQLLPIGPCQEKIANLLAHLRQYASTTDELAENTSRLVPAVIVEYFIAPVVEALEGVKGVLHSKEGGLEKLATPVKEEFGKLVKSNNPADFADYLKEIDKVKKRVTNALIDLGRHEDFINIMETGNTVLAEATAFSAWLRGLADALEEEFRHPESKLDLHRFAGEIRKKYYMVGFFAMLKRFFNKRLEAQLVYTVLKSCPVVVPEGDKGNIKELKDTTTLQNFLRHTLLAYEGSVVYKDVTTTMRQAIREYAAVLRTFMGNLPLNAASLPAFYDCDSLLHHMASERKTRKKT